MPQQGRTTGTETDGQEMPAGIRRAVLAGVALLLAGALYLIAVRGEALLAAAQSVAALCF